jgi:hypothetical protein
MSASRLKAQIGCVTAHESRCGQAFGGLFKKTRISSLLTYFYDKACLFHREFAMTHGTEEPSPPPKHGPPGPRRRWVRCRFRWEGGKWVSGGLPSRSDVEVLILIPSEADFEIRFAQMSIRLALPSPRSMEPPIPCLIALHTCRDVHVLGRETRHRGSGPRAIGGRWLWFRRYRQCGRTFHDHDVLEKTVCPEIPILEDQANVSGKESVDAGPMITPQFFLPPI